MGDNEEIEYDENQKQIESYTDLTTAVADLDKEVTVEQVNQAFQTAAGGALSGILECLRQSRRSAAGNR